MAHRHSMSLSVALAAFLFASPAFAVDVTGDYVLSVKPQPAPAPLALQLIGGQVDCTASAGSIVGAAYTTGGNGSPITLKISAGNSVDFAMNGMLIIVGPNGIRKASCGTTQTVTVTASQP